MLTPTQAETSTPLSKKLWPEDFTVVLVAPFPPPFGGMSLQADQLLHHLQQKGVPAKPIDFNQKLRGALAFIERVVFLRTLVHWIWFAWRVWKLALPKTVFHIFSHSYLSFFLWTGTAVLICRKRGVPAIINYRGGLAEAFLKKWRTPAALIFRQARKVVVPSQFLEFIFLQNGISTQVIPNIIKDELAPQPAREIKTPHLVVNRNFEPMYNVECALRAFALVQAKIPPAKLTLIGDGAQRAALERRVQEWGLRHVTFTGKLNNHEAIRALRDGDILLNPTNVDNMPISVIEAMALGIPIISTNVGGVPYLIQNKVNGILVKKNDHTAMARAVLRLVKSPALRQKLTARAQRDAEAFRWKNVWPLWRALYLSLGPKVQSPRSAEYETLVSRR